jgi:hypothetical protein
MSLSDALAAIDTEIAALDASIEADKVRLARLRGWREQAPSVDGDLAKPPPSDSEAPSDEPPAQRKPAARRTSAKQRANGEPRLSNVEKGKIILAKVEEYIRENPGETQLDIMDGVGTTNSTLSNKLRQLLSEGKIELQKEGGRTAGRYFPAGDAARPKSAPAQHDDAPAPDHTVARLPERRSSAGDAGREEQRQRQSAEKRDAGDRMKAVVLEILENKVQPMSRPDLVAAVQARVEVTKRQLNQVLIALGRERKITRIDSEEGSVFVFGPTLTRVEGGGEGPRTELERRIIAGVKVVPMTASEIALNLDPPERRMTVTTVLEAMARRGAIAKSSSGQIATYELVAEEAAAA